MGNFDTVILDMDGTILDTLEDIADSMNYVLQRHGFGIHTLQKIKSFIGNGVGNLMALSIPGGKSNPEYAACLQEFIEHYKSNMQNKTAPFVGIPELLKTLRDSGYKLAVVSNKFDGAVKIMNRMYFGEYIKIAIGETENMNKKPAPDIVYKALEELKSTKDKAVLVGDSDTDIQTARNAGLVSVGVTWGFRDREVLEQEGADYIIDKPEELLDILAG